MAGLASMRLMPRAVTYVSDHQSFRPIFSVCIAQFVVAFSLNFITAFMTLFIHSELDVPNLSEAAMWAGTGQFLFSSSLALMSPIWGLFCDRIGGKRMLLRVMVTHAVLMTLTSLATTAYHVLALRLIQGIMGGMSTIVMAIIASSVSEKSLPRAIGYQQSVLTAGALIGPGCGAAMATLFGFRFCFLFSGVMIVLALPFVIWGEFSESVSARARSAATREIMSWQGFREILPVMTALLAVQAAYGFVSPILPVYLSEAGIPADMLIQYTGGIMVITGLTYVVSVPITTRYFKRMAIPVLMATASGIVFLQGFFRHALLFICLRMVQCFLHSPGPSNLIGEAGGRKSNKGLTMGLLNSSSQMGGAIGPLVCSSVAYATNLTMAFMMAAAISAFAAMATIPRKRDTLARRDLSTKR